MNRFLFQPDVVAADAAAANIVWRRSASINYIKIANDMKIGRTNLEKLKITG